MFQEFSGYGPPRWEWATGPLSPTAPDVVGVGGGGWGGEREWHAFLSGPQGSSWWNPYDRSVSVPRARRDTLVRTSSDADMSSRSRSRGRSRPRKEELLYPTPPSFVQDWSDSLQPSHPSWWAGNQSTPLRVPVRPGTEEAAEAIWAISSAINESLLIRQGQLPLKPEEIKSKETKKLKKMVKSMKKYLPNLRSGGQGNKRFSSRGGGLLGYLMERGFWLTRLRRYQFKARKGGPGALKSKSEFNGTVSMWVNSAGRPTGLHQLIKGLDSKTKGGAEPAIAKHWKQKDLNTLTFAAPPLCPRSRPTLMVMRVNMPAHFDKIWRAPRFVGPMFQDSRRNTAQSVPPSDVSSANSFHEGDSATEYGGDGTKQDSKGCAIMQSIPWSLRPFILSNTILRNLLASLPLQDLQLIFYQVTLMPVEPRVQPRIYISLAGHLGAHGRVLSPCEALLIPAVGNR